MMFILSSRNHTCKTFPNIAKFSRHQWEACVPDTLLKPNSGNISVLMQSVSVTLSRVFLWKSVLKICTKFTEEHSCLSVISIKRYWNHTLAWVFSSKFAAFFRKNTPGRLLLLIHMKLIHSDQYFNCTFHH